MSGEILRLADAIHRDKEIDIEVVFEGIEAAYEAAAYREYGEEADVIVQVDRETGAISGMHDGKPIDPEQLGRIAAMSAKQIIFQKIREAERDGQYDKLKEDLGQVISGTVSRVEGNMVLVTLGKVEALLPRSEQVPGEVFNPGDRIRAYLLDVRKAGQRLKVILSRAHPDFVREMFEREVPEVEDRIVEIRAIAREAGYRTKVAVSSIDSKVDCVGACVGVRGSRIKNVLDELGGEKIDIIRYNESLQVMIPNALQPALIEEVQVYPRIGRGIVLVQDDQLSLAIGKRGQNVRLASKLCGLDIEIMTFDELTAAIDGAEEAFSEIPGIDEGTVDSLIEDGIFSFDDLSVMEVETVMELTGGDRSRAMDIIDYAERMSEEAAGATTSRSSVVIKPLAVPPPVFDDGFRDAAPAANPLAAMEAADAAAGNAAPAGDEPVPTLDELFPQDGPQLPPEMREEFSQAKSAAAAAETSDADADADAPDEQDADADSSEEERADADDGQDESHDERMAAQAAQPSENFDSQADPLEPAGITDQTVELDADVSLVEDVDVDKEGDGPIESTSDAALAPSERPSGGEVIEMARESDEAAAEVDANAPGSPPLGAVKTASVEEVAQTIQQTSTVDDDSVADAGTDSRTDSPEMEPVESAPPADERKESGA